ncbi:uncharacterized protein [Anoplolepis gracilipes]|uniref:uncharacterized protein n=1 Tax=Anoplolepis gracilipes TaxID=354296 RepID=UPI003B9EF4EA
MSSDETIGWIIKDNYVNNRTIDNSLTHKFTSSSKIRKRTKTYNTKVKKYGVKNYKEYVNLKTNVIRNLVEDTDTDNSSSLSDTDYDIIYGSLIQDEGSNDDFRNIFTDDKDFKKKINIKLKKKSNIKNSKASTLKRKPVETKCSTKASKKCNSNLDCQKGTKKNRDILYFLNNQTCRNNEENISRNNNHDYLKVQFNNQSSAQFDFQDSTTSNNIIKSVNENMKESCEDFNAMVNKSNTKSDLQNLSDSLSKYQASSSKSTSSRNIEGSDNESTIIKLESNKLAKISSENLISSKNYNNNTNESQKSKLKNVRRNLTSMLEEADVNNDKDIEKDKSKENRLSYDQLLVPTSSTPIKKTHTNVSKDLSPNTLSLDQQKYFIFDKDLSSIPFKFDERSLADYSDTEEKILASQQSKKIAKIETIASENSKEDMINDNILEQEKKIFSREEEVENSFQLNLTDKDFNQEVSLTRKITEEKMNLIKAEENIQKQQSLSPKKDDAKNVSLKSCDNISEEQDNKEESSEEKEGNSFQLNEIKDAEIYPINHKDKTCSVKLEDSCNIGKLHLLPKITCSEIINKKYTIINKQDNNTSIAKNDFNSQEKISEEINTNVSVTIETDTEEDNMNYISPETKKRLQQQARLNLVVSSDSSQSDDEDLTIETSRTHDNDSDTSSKDMFENDKINCENINADISHIKETTLNSPKEKKDSSNIKKEITKQGDKIPSKSAANKNLLKEIQYCNNVHNNDYNNYVDVVDESSELRVSENNVSNINEESKNQFSRNKSLDKENLCDKSNQNGDRMSDCTSELETTCKSRLEQNKQISTKRLNAHLDISNYRPCNLQQLIEDEKLLVETIPTSFTLRDLSEDDEAFILNLPNNVLQCNLQGQLLSLKEKTIKFGEDKYRVVRRKVGTVSCIFATGKQRRPYKTVNIKDISTITIQEKLPHCSRKSDVEYDNLSRSETYSTLISSELESSEINNEQANETSSIIDCNKRKRRISDFETEQSATKKGRLKLIQ